ncbi:oxygenase MpaB family protein [Saccharopolyspora cebuensis]|uniref:Oxygenase MpaB family protein n=1 Tax=Saccharopolyspora cebuensis TaxID=418759 RepID=A0ABV4CK10_9PSEU
MRTEVVAIVDDPERAGLPGPESETWRRFAALPGVFVAGTGLLLQVAHPVVGAGVLQHSDFRNTPWSRAFRTHLSTMRFVYGLGHGAEVEGDRLRRVHRTIRGVDEQGREYHALDPVAYAWVHLTLARFMVDTAAWFGTPMTEDETERMWQEFRAVGRALHVRDRHMPPDWAGASRWFDEVVHEVLESNQSTRDVLDSLAHPAPPHPLVPRRAWDLVMRPAGRVVTLTSVGILPEELRDRLGLVWTSADERRLRRFAGVVRAVMRVLPEPLRYPPLAYAVILRARWRQRTGRANQCSA